MRTLSELAQLTSGDLKMANADSYLKYSGKSKNTALPKFILYSGHARHVGSIMTAFDQGPLVAYPPPSSAIFY